MQDSEEGESDGTGDQRDNDALIAQMPNNRMVNLFAWPSKVALRCNDARLNPTHGVPKAGQRSGKVSPRMTVSSKLNH